MKVMTSKSAKEPLVWAELSDRKLQATEVRVAVRAAGVNPVDWKMRQGDLLGIAQRLIGPSGPLVCGIDFAGEVTEVGEHVYDLKVGDRVVGGTDFSRGQRGSYALQVQVRADQVAVLPPHVSFEDAGCLPVAGVTAHGALFRLGGLAERYAARAMILGAAGGVGHFAVQLAVQHGAYTVGVCSARNAALVRELGGHVIDYAQGNVAALAAEHGPYDVIVDAVGGGMYPAKMCMKMLKKDGVLIVVVPKGLDFLGVALHKQVKTILGAPNRATLTPLVNELAAGRLRVVIQERIPMTEAERAHQLSRAGKVVGKLVLVN